MTDPAITEICVKGKNLFRVLNPDAQESQRVPNFNPAEIIKNTTLDLDKPDFRIEGENDAVIFSRKIRED